MARTKRTKKTMTQQQRQDLQDILDNPDALNERMPYVENIQKLLEQFAQAKSSNQHILFVASMLMYKNNVRQWPGTKPTIKAYDWWLNKLEKILVRLVTIVEFDPDSDADSDAECYFEAVKMCDLKTFDQMKRDFRHLMLHGPNAINIPS